MALGNTIDVNWRVAPPVGPELPILPERYIPRPRLERRLSVAIERSSMAAMVAPAVSGKTTLIAGWSRSPGTPPLAYVSLGQDGKFGADRGRHPPIDINRVPQGHEIPSTELARRTGRICRYRQIPIVP